MRETSGVVLVRQEASGRPEEIFWSRRPAERSFLGGYRSFFVGGTRKSDARVPSTGGASTEVPERRFYGAAARELFEEAGLLFLENATIVSWRPTMVPGPLGGGWAAFRRAVCAGEVDFVERLREEVVAVDFERYRSLGRCLSPAWSDTDFATEFFTVGVSGDEFEQLGLSQLGQHLSDDEHESGAWLPPSEALAEWREGRAFLSNPIRHVIETLDGSESGERTPHLDGCDEQGTVASELVEVTGGLRKLPLHTPTLPPATHTNCYILGDEELVVVDPGSDHEGELELLLDALATLQDEGRALKSIILTHHHRDHHLGVEALLDRFDVPVWAHPETADRLELPVERRLNDGDVVDLPDHPLRCLHTPGHAPGHLALLHERTRDAFVGDLVASQGTILIDPPEGHMGRYMESLRRLRELEPRALFPAHGELIADPTKHLNAYIEHRQAREQKVLEALRAADGPTTPADLVPDVYDDTPRKVWPLAVRSLLAHLIHLHERGLADRNDDVFHSTNPTD